MAEEDCLKSMKRKKENDGKHAKKPKKRIKIYSSLESKSFISIQTKRCSLFSFVQKRALNGKESSFFFGRQQLKQKLYTSIQKVNEIPDILEDTGDHGSIFNLEFSPNNQYLLAACAKNDIVVYDPVSHKKVNVVANAHFEGVNCIHFINDTLFSTCSDDKTIAIWDVRKLGSRVFSLLGHTSWVKSLNYDTKSKNLISSAFDDTIRCWNFEKICKEGIIKSKKILNIPFLTRTKLSNKDGKKKLFVATTTGLLFAIHNLNLDTVKKDTKEDLQYIAMNYNTPVRLQSLPNIRNKTTQNTSNQIEFISSFPLESKPWCIASVQIHPTRDMVLSRYTTQRCDSEWSVVHTLQPDGKKFSLQHFIEEPNVSPGYIKELCYSNDGLLISSPFGNGIRLLSMNEQLNEEVTINQPQDLNEIKLITGHNSSVLTTRFSPVFPLVVSGCLNGKIVFHQPKF